MQEKTFFVHSTDRQQKTKLIEESCISPWWAFLFYIVLNFHKLNLLRGNMDSTARSIRRFFKVVGDDARQAIFAILGAFLIGIVIGIVWF